MAAIKRWEPRLRAAGALAGELDGGHGPAMPYHFQFGSMALAAKPVSTPHLEPSGARSSRRNGVVSGCGACQNHGKQIQKRASNSAGHRYN